MMAMSFRWLRIIGILLFIWIASQIDWIAVWRLLKDVRPGYVFGYFVVFVVAVLLRVVRLRWFLSCMGYKVAFKAVYQSVIEPGLYGMVTPARVGEFTKVFYLIKFGLTQKQAWGVILMERLVDFMVLLITSIAGGLYFFVWNHNAVLSVAVIILLTFCLAAVLRHSEAILRTILPVITLVWPGLSALPALSSMGSGLARISSLASTIFLPISIVILLLSFLQLSLLASALGSNVSGIYLGVAYATSTLVALLPISVSGLGTREVIYIAILSHAGISENIAVTISLLDGLVFGLLFLVILFIPIWIFKESFAKTRSANQ